MCPVCGSLGDNKVKCHGDIRYFCHHPEMVAFLAWGTVSSMGHKLVDVQ